MWLCWAGAVMADDRYILWDSLPSGSFRLGNRPTRWERAPGAFPPAHGHTRHLSALCLKKQRVSGRGHTVLPPLTSIRRRIPARRRGFGRSGFVMKMSGCRDRAVTSPPVEKRHRARETRNVRAPSTDALTLSNGRIVSRRHHRGRAGDRRPARSPGSSRTGRRASTCAAPSHPRHRRSWPHPRPHVGKGHTHPRIVGPVGRFPARAGWPMYRGRDLGRHHHRLRQSPRSAPSMRRPDAARSSSRLTRPWPEGQSPAPSRAEHLLHLRLRGLGPPHHGAPSMPTMSGGGPPHR